MLRIRWMVWSLKSEYLTNDLWQHNQNWHGVHYSNNKLGTRPSSIHGNHSPWSVNIVIKTIKQKKSPFVPKPKMAAQSKKPGKEKSILYTISITMMHPPATSKCLGDENTIFNLQVVTPNQYTMHHYSLRIDYNISWQRNNESLQILHCTRDVVHKYNTYWL